MRRFFDKFTKEEKSSWSLFLTVWIIYAIVSMAKNAYAASIASIVGEGMFTKAQAGTINASFYLFYGGAQLLGIKIIDKIPPVKLVTIALLGTIVSTLGMAVSRNFLTMLIFWSFCGLIQFSIWPAVLRIISEYLLPEHRGKAMVYIAFSYCAGALANYFAATIVLSFARWTMLFFVFSAILVLSVIVWICATRNCKPIDDINGIQQEKTEKNSQKPQEGFTKLLFISGMAVLLIPGFIRSTLDSGLKSWVPTMITENYGVSASFASMLTTMLVLINLSGVFIAGWLFPKKTKNVVTALGICFLTAVPLSMLLLLTGKIPVFLVVLLLAAVTTMMYAGHQFINVIVPTYFAKYQRAGSMASILNAAASFGIVVASIGFGYLAENFGWSATITAWIIMEAIAYVLCVVAAAFWKKFIQK